MRAAEVIENQLDSFRQQALLVRVLVIVDEKKLLDLAESWLILQGK